MNMSRFRGDSTPKLSNHARESAPTCLKVSLTEGLNFVMAAKSGSLKETEEEDEDAMGKELD